MVLGLLELIILSLASYRLTQLWVHDTLPDPLRDRLHAWHAEDHESRFRSFVLQLNTCIFCIGFWLSGAVLLTYLLASGQWGQASWPVHGIEWFAVAGGQALLNRAEDSWGNGQ